MRKKGKFQEMHNEKRNYLPSLGNVKSKSKRDNLNLWNDSNAAVLNDYIDVRH